MSIIGRTAPFLTGKDSHVTLVGYSVGYWSGSPTPALPSGTQQGDLMIMFGSGNSGGVWTPPAGWTDLFGTTGNAAACYKVAGASEPGSYVFYGPAAYSSGGIMTFRGCTLGVVGSAQGQTAASIDALSVTANAANSLLVALYGAIAQVSFNTPTGMTLVVTASTYAGLGLFTQEVQAGATGVRTSTTVGGSGDLTAAMLTLNPA